MIRVHLAWVGLLAGVAVLAGCRTGEARGPARDTQADEEVGRTEPPEAPSSTPETPRPEFPQEPPKSQEQ